MGNQPSSPTSSRLRRKSRLTSDTSSSTTTGTVPMPQPTIIPQPQFQSKVSNILHSDHTASIPEPDYQIRSSSNSGNDIPPSFPWRPKEDEFKILKKYDTIFIIDDSCSMVGEPWRQTRRALTEVVSFAARHDTDGIDIHFLNSTMTGTNLNQERQVEDLFNLVQPTGEITLIGSKLEDLLLPYLTQIEAAQRDSAETLKKIKRVNYIIITDGAPTDSPEEVIVAAARRLDKGHFPFAQVGIQFLQVGNSREATDYLRELDDVLAKEHQIRDMVDTTPYKSDLNGSFLMKCLLGGINRRVDRQSK